MKCDVLDLGLIEYEQAWKLQDEYASEIAAGTRPPTLLLLEHPHVYTFGRKGHAENLLWGEQKLKEKGIAVHCVDLGGQLNIKKKGKLVGYPLISLGLSRPGSSSEGKGEIGKGRIPDADYVGYVRKLEQMLIVALAHFGIAAGQKSGMTGVWVQADVYSRCPRCRPEDREKPAKIAAIGVKVDARGISHHGFALNINPDMSYWDGIVACGLADYPVVSLADLLPQPPELNTVKREIVRAFGEVFMYKTEWLVER